MTTGFIMQHIHACTTIKDTVQQLKGLHAGRYTKENKEGVSTDIKQSVFEDRE
jgi:hypothetical protein